MSSMEQEAEPRRLDARHLPCPLPVLKARKLLLGMLPGTRLEVLATDPAAWRDFPEFAQSSGHVLVEASRQADGVLRFVLECR